MAADTVSEEWRAIPGWAGLYEVSSHGCVRSLDRVVKGRSGPTRYKGRVLKPSYSTTYAMVTLVETGVGRRVQFYVHDLVLLVFVGPKPKGLDVCHGPLGGKVNLLTNLRYDTRSANAMDRHKFGTGWAKTGQRVPSTRRECAVCGEEMWVRSRRDVRHRLCKNPECLSTWGRICMLRKKRGE